MKKNQTVHSFNWSIMSTYYVPAIAGGTEAGRLQRHSACPPGLYTFGGVTDARNNRLPSGMD